MCHIFGWFEQFYQSEYQEAKEVGLDAREIKRSLCDGAFGQLGAGS